MLFYAVLIIACILAAAFFILIFTAMMKAGRSALETFFLRREARYARLGQMNPDLSETPTPWGWSAGNKPKRKRRQGGKRGPHSAIAKGPEPASEDHLPEWSGSSGLKRSNQDLIEAGLKNSAAYASVRSALTGYDLKPRQRVESTAAESAEAKPADPERVGGFSPSWPEEEDEDSADKPRGW